MTTSLSPFLPALTGLRFVAALHVVLYHALRPLVVDASDPLARLVANGPAAVTLFFVLSGFVLVYGVVDDQRLAARRFLVARFARIAPVYLLALAVALPIGIAARARGVVDDPLGALSLLLVATGLQAWVPQAALRWNPPAWSVACELFFYALLPLLLPALARIRRPMLLALTTSIWLLGLLAPIAYLVLDPDGLHGPRPGDEGLWLHVVQFNPLLRLPDFVVGVVAGLYWRRGGRLPAVVVPVAVVVSVVLTALPQVPRLLLHNGLLAPLFAVLIVGLAGGQGLLARLLSTAPLRRLGDASYALYLLHVPAIIWAMALTKQATLDPARAVVVVLATIPLAIIVHSVVERPGRDWLKARLMPPSVRPPTPLS